MIFPGTIVPILLVVGFIRVVLCCPSGMSGLAALVLDRLSVHTEANDETRAANLFVFNCAW